MSKFAISNFPLILAQESAPPVTPGTPAPSAPLAPSSTGSGTTLAPSGGAAAAPSSPGPNPSIQFILIIGVVGVMWFLMFNGQRKEKKRRAELLSAIKKGDRVQTVGGAIGTVTELRDADITIRVDDNTGTRIRFARSAVQTILGDDEKPQNLAN